jgi:DNA-binding XRE family transcriptional regulator
MKPDDLRNARKKLKLSQRALAKDLEISERSYIYRETGVFPISRMMGYAINWLLHRSKKGG